MGDTGLELGKWRHGCGLVLLLMELRGQEITQATVRPDCWPNPSYKE